MAHQPFIVMLGIEKLKLAIVALVGLGMAFDKSFADGKFSFTDTLNFVGPAQQMPTSLEELENIKAEFEDLDEEEGAQVAEFVAAQLDLRNDNVEELIEDSIDLGVTVYVYVNKHFLKN